jgi:hypothetical protein
VTSPVRLPITCPKYEAVPGTKRCRHYHANGACGLPDEFMCVEWLKVNGHAPSAPVTPPPTTAALRRDEAPVVRTLSDADIASFKALGTEVRLATEGLGDIWLVPAYTGAERQELSVDHAALIAAVASAFPGAHVTALVRKPKPPVPS